LFGRSQDQEGWESARVLLETFHGLDPPVLTIQIWLRPDRVLAKATRFPFGEKDGCECAPPPRLSRRGSDPSASMTQTRPMPPRTLTRAIVSPSGE
jgi:hypothetical protein